MGALYLGYGASDRDRALELLAGLRSAGLDVRGDDHLAGDSAWWDGVLTAVREAGAFLYARSLMGGSPAASSACEYAAGLGLPVLEIHLAAPSGVSARPKWSRPPSPPIEAVVDFSVPAAASAFRVLGAISDLSEMQAAVRSSTPPPSPFAEVEDLAREVCAIVLGKEDQARIVEGLTHVRDRILARELATVLRHRTDLDQDTVAALNEAFPWEGGAPAEGDDLTADTVHGIGFHRPAVSWRGYDERGVDEFLDLIEDDLRARRTARKGTTLTVHLTPSDVRAARFARPPFGRRGYDQDEVDAFLAQVERAFTTLDAALHVTKQPTP